MRIFALIATACLIHSSAVFGIDPKLVTQTEFEVDPDVVQGPAPVGNPGAWVTPNDYPAEALRNNSEGTTSFRLIVDAHGNPVSCIVTESSGFPTLDDATCKGLISRAKFDPATNDHSVPVVGAWSSRVRWQIPQRRIIAVPPPQYWVATYIVEADGTVSSCEMDKAEGGAEYYDFCGELPRFRPATDEDGRPVRSKIKVFHRLVHEEIAQ